MKRIIIILIPAVLLLSCIPENPYLSEEEIEKVLAPPPFHLALILDNDVYLIEGEAANDPIQLTFDGNPKTEVKISFDGKKVAYLDNSGTPYIIDIESSTQHAVSNASSIIQMDWIDNSTLYMFNGYQITYEGTAIETPDFTAEEGSPYNDWIKVKSACINKNSELVYTLDNGYDYWDGDMLVFKTPSEVNYITTGKYLAKASFDSEGKVCVCAASSPTERYLYDDYAIYDTFEQGMTASRFWSEDHFGEDFTQHLFLEERLVMIIAEETSDYGSDYNYKIYIQDYARTNNPPVIKYYSVTKIFFDFKYNTLEE